jgi:sugar O-acyltransferase (sialic acid O-acetyltransferase NeuD family)
MNEMKRLLIIGAGGFGREVLSWCLQDAAYTKEWEVAGFLDSNPAALDKHTCEFGILGDPSTYSPSGDDLFVLAIGDPKTKLRLCKSLKERGASFTTLLHPTVVIGRDCRIGEGCVLCPGAVLTTNVSLGNFVIINVHSTVGHDSVIGDGSTLSAHNDVTGNVVLGEGVFLGTHACILPNTVVGDYAIVGAGSMVLKKVPAHSTVVGVPARQIAGFDS